MENLKLLNEFLYTIYLISAGPILIYIAYKGLEQIKAAKENTKISQENAKTQSKRESYKLAGEQCQYLGEKIMSNYTKLFKELENSKSKFFDKFDVQIDSKEIKIKTTEKLEDIDFEGLQNSEYLQDVLNSIEGFSLYFASGVASEKVGYITAGRGYCSMVKRLLPLLIPEFNKGYYKNTLYLFSIWHNRCKQDDLKMKQRELEKEIKETTVTKIPTIGVD